MSNKDLGTFEFKIQTYFSASEKIVAEKKSSDFDAKQCTKKPLYNDDLPTHLYRSYFGFPVLG